MRSLQLGEEKLRGPDTWKSNGWAATVADSLVPSCCPPPSPPLAACGELFDISLDSLLVLRRALECNCPIEKTRKRRADAENKAKGDGSWREEKINIMEREFWEEYEVFFFFFFALIPRKRLNLDDFSNKNIIFWIFFFSMHLFSY